MAELTTVAELGTAAGTLVLAVATFFSTRSANRAARVAERSLLLGLRPTLMPSRAQDPPVDVDFRAVERFVRVEPGRAIVVAEDTGETLLAISVRNTGAGLAVLRGWSLRAGSNPGEARHTAVDDFRRLARDLYVSPGDVGFWQGAIREAADPLNAAVRGELHDGGTLAVEVLYSDQEGGQSYVTRFTLRNRDGDWTVSAGRHWDV